MKRPIVQKYGGSSLADVEGIRAVARRVVGVAQARPVVVVVSAMGNTTNELLALAREVSTSPTRRELDLLVSVGERVSMTLLAMAIEDLGVRAESFTGSQSGIITDGEHVRARVVEVRPHRIERALAERKVAIVAGFQGVSRGGDVTTLGRGGSDTTAVVLAAALSAEYCEICSDVDGIYTADPRVVPEARRVEKLDIDLAMELTAAGARVLAAEAVDAAKRWGVVLRATATDGPVGVGTEVVAGAAAAEIVVAVHADLEAIEIPVGASVSAIPACFAAIPGEGVVRLLLDLRNLPERDALTLPDGARSLGTMAAVSAVGAAIGDGTWSVALAAVGLAPWVWWTRGTTFTVVVALGEAADVQRSLHAALVEGVGPS